MGEETLEQAANRLEIIAADLRRRYRWNECIAPISVPNGIAAARLILGRLERETKVVVADPPSHADRCPIKNPPPPIRSTSGAGTA